MLSSSLAAAAAHRGDFRQLVPGSRNEPRGSCVGKWGERGRDGGESRGEGGEREMNGEGKGGRRWGWEEGRKEVDGCGGSAGTKAVY